jgi:hypothetical protein
MTESTIQVPALTVPEYELLKRLLWTAGMTTQAALGGGSDTLYMDGLPVELRSLLYKVNVLSRREASR